MSEDGVLKPKQSEGFHGGRRSGPHSPHSDPSGPLSYVAGDEVPGGAHPYTGLKAESRRGEVWTRRGGTCGRDPHVGLKTEPGHVEDARSRERGEKEDFERGRPRCVPSTLLRVRTRGEWKGTRRGGGCGGRREREGGRVCVYTHVCVRVRVLTST